MYVFKWHIVLNKKKIITLRAKFSHHNMQTPTSLYQIHMLDSRWIADDKDIKQCLWFLRSSHTIDILFVLEMPHKQHNKRLHSKRWSPLTLEKNSTSLYIFTSKRKLREKVEWRQAWAFQKLEENMSLYICFCFWIVWGCQTDGPRNFASCWHHKKDMMGMIQIVVCAKWM
jgi:hypothetical protein